MMSSEPLDIVCAKMFAAVRLRRESGAGSGPPEICGGIGGSGAMLTVFD